MLSAVNNEQTSWALTYPKSIIQQMNELDPAFIEKLSCVSYLSILIVST